MADIDFSGGISSNLRAALEHPVQRTLQSLENDGLTWMDSFDDKAERNALQRWREAEARARVKPDEGSDDLEAKVTSWLAWAYGRSASWLWYSRSQLQASEAPLFKQQRRLFLRREANGAPDAWPTTVLLLPARNVGVVTTWVEDEARADPAEARALADQGSRDALFERVVDLIPEFAVERQYPFVSVQVDATDLTQFCDDEFTRVSAWLTGGFENESDERRRALVAASSNLSVRRYERLFLRWTDALALYSRDVGHEDHQLAKLRAAQLFEHCVLSRRLLRSYGREISALSSSVDVLGTLPTVSRRWRRGNAVLTAFSQAEYEMVTAPPVCSVEAEDLVDSALEKFGIPELVRDTRRAYEILDRRLQWSRGQWIAVLAVVAFVIQAILTLLA